MKPTQVAILGCGPAGLLAAHAVLLAGHEPRIFSKKLKSKMPGTQYLHQPIPDLTSDQPDGEVRYIKRGTKQGYATKVYGSPDAACSWVKFGEGKHDIWHLGRMYDQLWDTFETSIYDEELDSSSIGYLARAFPLVISSVPAPRVCGDALNHNFRNQTIWISESLTDADSELLLDINSIIYDGTDDRHWYRASLIFGKVAVETTKPMADQGWIYGHKPIDNNCDCHKQIKQFHRVGRFGQWKKGVLTHNAFWDTIAILEKTVGRQEHAML